jgi:hypothetical protein
MKKAIGFKSGPFKTNDVAYTFAAPMGVPGDVTRTDESNVEPIFLITPFPTNYGVAMVAATGGGTPFAAAGTAATVIGLLVRAVPGISNSSSNEAVDQFTPNQAEVQGLMVRGYACVAVNAGTPVRGSAVGIVQTASGGHPAGAFETTTTGNNIPLSSTVVGNWTWAQDGVDPNGYGEVRIAQ